MIKDSEVASTSKVVPLTDMMRELRESEWYYGSISSRKAEKLLKDRLPGNFLVRDSGSDCYLFAISFKSSDGVYHTRVQFHNGRYCLGGPNTLLWANNLVEFVEKAVQSSRHSDSYDILMHPSQRIESSSNVCLLYPLRRRDFLPSLKHLSRLVIRHSMTEDRFVSQLPLPRALRRYVASSNYLYPL